MRYERRPSPVDEGRRPRRATQKASAMFAARRERSSRNPDKKEPRRV